MNAFKVTYTDGTHYTTNANGTAAEFEAYLTQAGRTICTYENPETGAETFKTIEKVQQVPQIGEVYEFQNYDGNPAYLKVVNVDNTHVFYKWHGEPTAIHTYPMTLELWNAEEYKFTTPPTEYPMIEGEGAPQYTFALPAEPTQLALL